MEEGRKDLGGESYRGERVTRDDGASEELHRMK